MTTIKNYFQTVKSSTHDIEVKDGNMDMSPPIKIQKLSVDKDVINLLSDEEFEDSDLDMELLMVTPDISVESNSIDSGSNLSFNSLLPVTPETPTHSKSTSDSTEKKKYYSPNKKKLVQRRTPVKRNIQEKFVRNMELLNTVEAEQLSSVYAGMDDKTIFLLKIIDNYLKDESLKHLLDEKSQELLSRHVDVVKPGMRLVCRLYWYQEGWYRQEKLRKIVYETKKVEDSDMINLITCIEKNGFIDSDTDMSFDDIVNLLKIDELKQTCKHFNIKYAKQIKGQESQTKRSVIEALRKYCQSKNITHFFSVGPVSSNQARVVTFMKEKAGPCYKLSDVARRALYHLYNLMYLGIDYSIIRDKKLELMLIYDKTKEETYPLDKSVPVDSANVVFKSRDEFISYIEARSIYEDFLSQKDGEVKCKIVSEVYDKYRSISNDAMTSYITLPLWLHTFTPAYLYVKILESGVQDLKRNKSTAVALDILNTLIAQYAFRQHKKAEWYAEKALLLHAHLGSHDEAAVVLLEGFESTLSDEAKDVMRPRALKIANQKNSPISEHLKTVLLTFATKQEILEKNFNAKYIQKMPMLDQQRGKKKFVTQIGDDKVVQDAEDCCISEYIASGLFTHGRHWEGGLVSKIFLLLFWDIIYAKPRNVLGVFLCHYQMFPLDLICGGTCFYNNRKAAIDKRLVKIESSTQSELVEMIRKTWDARPQNELPRVRDVSWDDVTMSIQCLPPRATAAICRRLAHNYQYARSGFPDLTLWNINTNKTKFVEVKTDTDKPSMKQLQWMRYLKENDIDTEFCYIGVNKTCSKSRPAYNTHT